MKLECEEQFGNKAEDWVEPPNDYFNHWHVEPSLLHKFIVGDIQLNSEYLVTVRKLIYGAFLYDKSINRNWESDYTVMEQILILFFYPMMKFDGDINLQMKEGFENAVRIHILNERYSNGDKDTGNELDPDDGYPEDEELLEAFDDIEVRIEDFLNLD